MEWMIMPLKRYAQFSGRSRRKEYWMFVLFTVLVNMAFVTLMLMFGGGALFAAMGGANPDSAGIMAAGGAVAIIYLISVIFSLAILVPSIAVGVRRLHDTDRSGWWLLAPIAPYIVMIVLGFAIAGTMASGGAADGLAVGMTIAIGICGLAAMILGIVLLVFMCLEGTSGVNRFGPDPKNPDANFADVFS